MPFLAKENVPIPTKDLLSWAFDDLSYDWDKPVSYALINLSPPASKKTLKPSLPPSTRKLITNPPDLHRRPEPHQLHLRPPRTQDNPTTRSRFPRLGTPARRNSLHPLLQQHLVPDLLPRRDSSRRSLRGDEPGLHFPRARARPTDFESENRPFGAGADRACVESYGGGTGGEGEGCRFQPSCWGGWSRGVFGLGGFVGAWREGLGEV